MKFLWSTFRAAMLMVLLGAMLAGCGAAPLESRPTAQPVVRVTPAPTQDVAATQTAFARQSIPTPTPAGLYIVKAGDTLGKIADSFETTVDEIIALNKIADPNQIEVGQRLIIPSLLTPTAESFTQSTATP